MHYIKNLLLALGLASSVLFIACSEDEPEAPNEAPTVESPVSDQTFEEGFGSATINLASVFNDAETTNLTITATSSDESVVTVTIGGTSLTITEAGVGNATITLTATDDEGATATDQFVVSVSAATNNAPTVVNPISDLSLIQGFGTETVVLANVFTDVETMMLQFSATSSETGVVTVSVERADLTITEVGLGTSIITVTAMDEDGGTVSDEFEVSVSETTPTVCDNDNSIATALGSCDETPGVSNTYSETINGDVRVITTNGIPNHDFSNQNPTAKELNSDNKSYQVDATPAKENTTTSILTADSRPRVRFGLALNGVAIDPAPAEPFIFTDSNGEYNWDWVFEPTNNTDAVGLDCAQAHVQPDGTYHYHGDMVEYANTILSGLGDGSATPTEPVQIGWSADGFPILYKYGPDASGNLKMLESSYRLIDGERPGDGDSAPCGEYNGKYTNDYEYVANAGDLDECNGVDRSITLGGETFNYFYVITDTFPIISRCFVGSPDSSFNLGGM